MNQSSFFTASTYVMINSYPWFYIPLQILGLTSVCIQKRLEQVNEMDKIRPLGGLKIVLVPQKYVNSVVQKEGAEID